MRAPPHLVHCMMHVSDLERAIGFYGEVLGFAVVDLHRYEGHDLAYLRSPTSAIEIELVRPHAGHPDEPKLAPDWHLGFAVENLEGEFDRLSGLGVRLDPIELYEANGVLQTRYFYLYDPDGHQLELLEARGRYAMARQGAGPTVRAGGCQP